MKTQKKKITIQDIAKEMGISASSVSRSLNNNLSISIETRQKVWEIAKKLGYQSNNIGFLPSTSKNILFLVDRLSKISDLQKIEQIQKKIKYNSIIKIVSNDDLKDNRFNNFLLQYKIEGIINFVNYSKQWNDKFGEISDLNIPIISLNNSEFDKADINIIADYYNVIHSIIEHLDERKATKILLIREKNNPFYQSIENAFLLSKDNFNNISFEVLSTELNQASLKYELEKISGYDAIISPDYNTALIVYQLLQRSKKNIPEDVMIVSIEHLDNTLIFPKITSIQFEQNDIINEVVNLIDDVIINKNKQKRIIVKKTKLDIKPSSMRVL